VSDDIESKLSGKSEGTILGGVREKLIRTKEQWAAEGRGLSGENPPEKTKEKTKEKTSEPNKKRLPPGQRLTSDFPVLDLGVQPDIPLDQWRFTVSGLVENQIDWDWQQFNSQPQTTLVNDIHCVTTWSRYDNEWQGVCASHLLDVVKPKPNAAFLVFYSHDGYTTNVPLSAFDDTDVMLAHSWNGKPLTRAHGGPVRPIIPKLYFWKSAKWIKHITFMDKDAPGFWEVRGYNNNADPWKEERYG